MGHYTKRPTAGQRAGVDVRKKNKERMRGRIEVKSLQMYSISERKRRLGDLEQEISRECDPQKREPLYKKYANLAASCPPEVFTPDEITGIEKYATLSDNKLLESFSRNYFQGSRRDFLPLHHLVKLLSKSVPNNPNNKFIYLLGSTSATTPDEIALRNLKGLEYFLLTFAQRMPRSHYLDVEVDKKRVQVPSNDEYGFSESDPVVARLRSQLRAAGIIPSDHFHLKRIRDGNHKIDTLLHIITEQKSYRDEERQGKVLVAYLSTRA